MLFSKCLFRFVPLSLASLFLAACSDPEARDCPYIGEKAAPANAGCVITHNDTILTVTARLDGSLAFPGGTTDNGEPPRCTAYRETYEEVGFDVRVGKKLHTFANGFELYQCEPVNTAVYGADLVTNDALEVSRITWTKVDALSKENWRFPKAFDESLEIIQQQSQK